jgi:hypothetical protein
MNMVRLPVRYDIHLWCSPLSLDIPNVLLCVIAPYNRETDLSPIVSLHNVRFTELTAKDC